MAIYVDTLQQVLCENMGKIAHMYPSGIEQDNYVAAAASCALVYWNWALKPSGGGSVLPSSMQQPEVAVDGPMGNQTITNPFFTYGFDPLIATDMGTEPVSIISKL